MAEFWFSLFCCCLFKFLVSYLLIIGLKFFKRIHFYKICENFHVDKNGTCCLSWYEMIAWFPTGSEPEVESLLERPVSKINCLLLNGWKVYHYFTSILDERKLSYRTVIVKNKTSWTRRIILWAMIAHNIEKVAVDKSILSFIYLGLFSKSI